MTEKTCTTCKSIKPLDNFPIPPKDSISFSNSSKQHSNICKDCHAIRAREFRKKNKNYIGTGKISKYTIEERRIVSAIGLRINQCKVNFKKRNPEGEFTLDRDSMYELFKKQDGLCALSGKTLEIKKKTPHSLSIDKIDCTKGYTLDNVQWVTWAVNRAKGDLTQEQLLEMCRAITRTCND